MNIRNLLRTTFGALLLIGCFLSVEQSVSAEPADNCMKLKGNFTDENAGPGQTAGQITKAGILNGSTQRVFNSGALPTPDPTTVSFTGDYTVTTNRGVLKTHDVYIFDFATGLAAAIHRIDPNASTGIFAGATGVLYDNAKSTGPATVGGDITGQICFPK